MSVLDVQVLVPPVEDELEDADDALSDDETAVVPPPLDALAFEPPAPEVELDALVVSAVEDAVVEVVVSVLLHVGLAELDTVPEAPLASQYT